MDSKFAPTNSRLPLKSFGLNPSEINIDKLARKAGVLPATVNRVMLQKNGQPLGIGIVAAKPENNAPYGIYIRHIVPESVAAAQDGRLECGDQILAIANSSLVNCDQSETAVVILARITNTVHLVVAKRAAQARCIINLINSAQSGRPLPNPMSRSNVSLNRTTSLNQVNIDDINDDDDDDNEDGGARTVKTKNHAPHNHGCPCFSLPIPFLPLTPSPSHSCSTWLFSIGNALHTLRLLALWSGP
nr:AFaDin (actin filament binding protein) [Hymenolepis microstoma]